ncbi:MAG: DEAD/DEAH box helicase, partial [Caldilineaceae bacterium]
MINLRPYQHEAIIELRKGFSAGHVRQIVGAPTGSGKTVLAAAIAQLAQARGRQAWFLCDRTALIRQTVRSFEELGLSVGTVWRDIGSCFGDEDVVVASTQTLASRRRTSGKLPDKAGMIIIDEAHILHRYHIDLMTRWDAMPVVGLSATPMRKGLGRHFTNLVRGPTIAELIEQGYLVGFRAYGPSEPDLRGVHIRGGDFVESELADVMADAKVIGDVVSNWERLGENRSTIIFAVNIAHSTALVEAFCAAGHAAAHIDCHTPEATREEIYRDFRSGRLKILCSVAVLALGFDVPSVSCVVMARPTMSEALYIQQAGRGTRMSP